MTKCFGSVANQPSRTANRREREEARAAGDSNRRAGISAAGLILLLGPLQMDGGWCRSPPVIASHAVHPQSPVATEAEQAWLKTILQMPIAGISASELRDTFNDQRGDRRHEALDIPAPKGTPVLSATDGRVLRLLLSDRGGLMVYAADPSERFVLLYGHLERYEDDLREGATLCQGQVLGYVGTTGNASPTAPHLHFGILRAGDVRKWWQGMPVDPRPLLIPSGPAGTPTKTR